LHFYDVLRANKSTAGCGVEVRVPFLDKDFMTVVMNLDPKYKMIGAESRYIEKYILRSAFSDPQDPVLPDSVLWRQKEQFSDGVGYGWIDGLKDHAARIIPDVDLANVSAEYAYNTPSSKEALWYRRIFDSHFPGRYAALTLPGNLSSTVACSTAKAIEWDESFRNALDPSGRSVKDVHNKKQKTAA
jgi:asparagine synthase (glutamine-hydrolysing)